MSAANTERPLVIVTGSSGLIGTALGRALGGDFRVVGFDIKQGDAPAPQMDFIECDLTEDESVADALGQVRKKHGGRIASVVHLAAYYDFSGEPSPLYEKLTVGGTRRLLEALQDFETGQFIFSSSLLVMKPVEPGEVLTESSPCQAEWEYPQSKLDAEEAIRQHRGNIPAVVLRIAGVYDEDCNSLPIAQQISRIHQKTLESYFFPGDAQRGQSFVHLADLVDGFCKTIDRRGDLGEHETFLVGEPDVMSYAELQDRIGELLHGKQWPTVRVPKPVAKAGAWAKEKLGAEEETFIKPWMIDLADAHYPVDISRARQRLGWQPNHRLRDTLPEMIARLQRDPSGWYEKNGLPVPADAASTL